MTFTPPSTDHDTIDLTGLTARLDERYAERFSEDHVIEWLRTSGGTLADQIMKRAAADLIERYAARAAELDA